MSWIRVGNKVTRRDQHRVQHGTTRRHAGSDTAGFKSRNEVLEKKEAEAEEHKHHEEDDSGGESDVEDDDDVNASATPTPSKSAILQGASTALGASKAGITSAPSFPVLDDDDDDDGGYDSSTVTRTVVQGAESASTDQSAPAITTSSAPTTPGGMSEGTEHLLIVIFTILGTLTILVIAFVGYRLRQGVPKNQLFKLHPNRRNPRGQGFGRSAGIAPNDVEAPIGSTQAQSTWNTTAQPEPAIAAYDYASRGEKPDEPTYPAAALTRQGTSNSAGSAKTLGDTLSSQRKVSQERAHSPPKPKNLPLRSNESKPAPPSPHEQQSISRPKTTYEFPDELTPMPHLSFMLAPREQSDPNESRFSWSTYRDVQTPTTVDNRVSAAPSVASTVPRFRTVQSWVQHQQSQYDGDHHNKQSQVPDIPQQYRNQHVAPKMPLGVGTSQPAMRPRDDQFI